MKTFKEDFCASLGACNQLNFPALLPDGKTSGGNVFAALILFSSVVLSAFALYGSSQGILRAQALSTSSAPASSQQSDAGITRPSLTLSAQDRERIRAEEIFRDEVRREIEAESATKSAQDQVWSVLNSSFALWFLSSVVLAGITAAFAWYQKNHSERVKQSDLQRRLRTEISSRIAEGLIAMRLDIKRIDNGQRYWGSAIYNEALYYLDNEVRDGARVLDFSIYPEYRFRKLRSLLFELTSVAEASVRLQLSATKEGYTKLIELSDTVSMGEDYSKTPDKSISLDAIQKAIEILEGIQANSLWRAEL